jgi:hypothetical protein
MEAQERKLAVDQLTGSREKLLGLVDGLTTDQWAFRPAEGRWSINECLEHVTNVENRVLGIVTTKLAEGALAAAKPEVRGKDEAVMTAVLDRTTRRQAPEPVQPSGKWADSQLLDEFGKARQRTIDFTATTDADLRGYFNPHPAFGELDCYQWVVLLSLHGLRHALQIEEIKASVGFPGKASAVEA